MPKQRNGKTRQKKMRKNRKSPRFAPGVGSVSYPSLSMGSSLVAPQESRASLKFQALISVAATNYTSAQYALNNPFDPLIPVGGGACTGFAQWMGLYDFCFVDRCDLSFTYFNTSSTSAYMYAVAYPSYQTVQTPTRDLLLESTTGVSWVCYANSPLYNPHTLKVQYDLRKIEGTLTPKRDYSCSAGFDPVHEISVDIGAFTYDGGSSAIGGTITLELTYHCVFWQKKTFGTG